MTTMTTMLRRARRLSTAAGTLGAAVLLLACADTESKVAPTEPALTTPGIHPVVVVASQTGGEAKLELRLERVAVVSKIASYQGELTYDRAALQLKSASIPAGITGAWNEVRPGVLRFTGVAVDGVPDGAVLAMTFAASAPVEAKAITLKMEELVASEGFADLKAQLRQQGASPMLSRARQ
jgi:hypothetical protein